MKEKNRKDLSIDIQFSEKIGIIPCGSTAGPSNLKLQTTLVLEIERPSMAVLEAVQ